MTLSREEELYKAPEPTELRKPRGPERTVRDWVRVANPSSELGGQVWQYGYVDWVFGRQLVNINYDGGEDAKNIPTFEVYPTRP